MWFINTVMVSGRKFLNAKPLCTMARGMSIMWNSDTACLCHSVHRGRHVQTAFAWSRVRIADDATLNSAVRSVFYTIWKYSHFTGRPLRTPKY
jgi:hypothetical protein